MSNSLLALSRPRLGAAQWAGRVRQLYTRALLAVRVYRERRALALLDAHTLRDLGLCRGDVIAESSRPFWDLPPERTWS
jgi:uncharacterized protein YjiS (DUF1127 family)